MGFVDNIKMSLSHKMKFVLLRFLNMHTGCTPLQNIFLLTLILSAYWIYISLIRPNILGEGKIWTCNSLSCHFEHNWVENMMVRSGCHPIRGWWCKGKKTKPNSWSSWFIKSVYFILLKISVYPLHKLQKCNIGFDILIIFLFKS